MNGSAAASGRVVRQALEARLTTLSPDERVRVQQLLEARDAHAGPRPGAAEGVAAPLSFGQERLWFAQAMTDRHEFFNCPTVLRMHGQLEIGPLRRALRDLADRQQVLRRRIEVVDGVPRFAAELAPPPELRLATAPGASADQCAELLGAEVAAPFDLAREAPVRVLLVRIAADDHLLVLTLHHAVTDEHSEAILIEELGRLYESHVSGVPADLGDLPVQYADVALWQRRRMSGPLRGQLLDRWRERLTGSQQTLALPGARGFDAPSNSAAHRTTLPPEVSARLAGLVRSEGAPLSAAYLGLLRVVLARHTGQADFLIGVPGTGRTSAACEGLVGYFLNLLPIRHPGCESLTARELVQGERTALLSAYADQELPFGLLVEELGPGREHRASPLVQVHYNHVHAAAVEHHFGALRVELVEPAGSASHFPLSLTTALTAEGTTLDWVYDPDQLDASWVRDLAERFAVLAEAAGRRPELPLRDLPVLTDQDRRLLASLESAGQAAPGPGPVAAVRAWALRDPGRVAVRAGAATRSYQDLCAAGSWVTHRLSALSLPAESVVGVLMARTADLPGVLLGVLATGMAYLPLAPGLPARRLAELLADAGARAVITDGSVELPDLPADTRVLELPATEVCLRAPASQAPTSEPHPSQLAYVLYTSGSTGAPKGVAVTYGALSRLLRALQEELPEGAAARTLALTTVGFDISGVELFLPFLEGGEVVIADLPQPPDGHALLDAIARAHPTLVQATPASWQLLSLSGWDGSPEMFAISGGDRLLPTLAQYIRQRCRGLWNGYGPTEATIYATGQHVGPCDDAGLPSVPIGRPIGHVDCYVLDAELRRVPPGVTGELHLGGLQLARGYLGRPALTADRFLPDPHGAAGQRLYRTGDLVRWRQDGSLEYLGRSDRQIKVRGFRVEPAEVENALLRDPALREAVVTVRQDGQGDAVLAAYVVVESGRTFDATQTKAALGRELPAHLVPSILIATDALPRTPSGKYDLAALPETTVSLAHTGPGSELDGPTQTAIGEIWESLLGVRPGADQDFFSLGGHSLSLMRLSYFLGESFGVRLGVGELFRNPTVAAQAELVESLALAAFDDLSDEEFQRLVSTDT